MRGASLAIEPLFAWRHFFHPEVPVNDDREGGRRLRRWPEGPSLTGLQGETRSAVRNDGSSPALCLSLSLQAAFVRSASPEPFRPTAHSARASIAASSHASSAPPHKP